MPTLLRWILKGLTGLLAFVVAWTGVWGVPASIAEQITVLREFPDELYIRALALLLAFALALVAIGPTRVQAWLKAASDWWHAEARRIRELEKDNERLEQRK